MQEHLFPVPPGTAVPPGPHTGAPIPNWQLLMGSGFPNLQQSLSSFTSAVSDGRPPTHPSTSTTRPSQPRTSSKSAADANDESAAAGGAESAAAKAAKRKRNSPTPWTEEEHKLFLQGLSKYGKGNWRVISSEILQSRTPIQIASHAQKYFEHINGSNAKRRRTSIFSTVMEDGSLPCVMSGSSGDFSSSLTNGTLLLGTPSGVDSALSDGLAPGTAPAGAPLPSMSLTFGSPPGFGSPSAAPLDPASITQIPPAASLGPSLKDSGFGSVLVDVKTEPDATEDASLATGGGKQPDVTTQPLPTLQPLQADTTQPAAPAPDRVAEGCAARHRLQDVPPQEMLVQGMLSLSDTGDDKVDVQDKDVESAVTVELPTAPATQLNADTTVAHDEQPTASTSPQNLTVDGDVVSGDAVHIREDATEAHMSGVLDDSALLELEVLKVPSGDALGVLEDLHGQHTIDELDEHAHPSTS
eukprot:CAMPEP_0175836200 /NCGR_PEP_ID=MMETSP0107_2-20121207/17017_1 /TAXON_ID=195067 ORGANISM="Goniomonas pacifica, Strain CCMP1869" /NCGR_SAMPLE_ID=MMETSP0107_2 /ASSEMBLY_ACC=CAM_ASM_000203 /LENGTH=469 /DNA_ID=CAMNT_0017149581 /DNA_START=1 /DNA_END=1410 /DNA_ORIENTATION=-